MSKLEPCSADKITPKERQDRLKRALELSSEISEIANSFGGEKYGDVAVKLHRANNQVLYSVAALEAIDGERGDLPKIYNDEFAGISDFINDQALIALQHLQASQHTT